MASVNALAATVFAASDPQKALDFFGKFVDCTFPEFSKSRELDAAAKMKELNEFSKKEVMLVPGKWGFELQVKEKEK